MTVPSPAENAATVREGLLAFRNAAIFEKYPESIPDDCLTALAALLAQAEAGAKDSIRRTDLLNDALDDRDAAVRERDQAREALRDQAEPIMDERFRDRLLRHVLSNEEVGQLVDAIESREARARAALTGEGTEPDDGPDDERHGELAGADEGETRTTCIDCGRPLRGYWGPRCRYCDGAAE